MSTLFNGLDVSLKSVAAAFMVENGKAAAKRITFANNPQGVDLLADQITSACSRLGLSQVEIGMEATGNLSFGLAHALREHRFPEDLRVNVHLLNARQVAHLKKVFGDTSKTDPVDASMIAEYLRFRRLDAPRVIDERYLALQTLTRHRYHLACSLADEKNRFISKLFLKFSGFRQDKPLSDTFGAAASALLTEFLTVDEIARLSINELADFIQEKGKGGFDDPCAVASAIKEAAAKSYRLDARLVDPVNHVLGMTLQSVRYFEHQIDEIEKVIARQLRAFAHEATVLSSVPGFGPVFTAGLIAEIADIRRFDNDSALARYSSIAWKQTQSGEFSSDDTPMMRSGNQYLRYYFFEAANCLRLHNEEFAAYYQTKYREANAHHHKRACVLTARKLVRLVFRLLHEGVLYKTPDQRKEYRAAHPLPEGTTPGELARHIQRRRQAKKAYRVHVDH